MTEFSGDFIEKLESIIGYEPISESHSIAEAILNEFIRLKKENELLNTTTYCAYCGAGVALDNDAPNLVREHIRTCKKHPMRHAEAEIVLLKARVQELEQELKNKCANCGLIISHGIWGDEDSEYDALSPTEDE